MADRALNGRANHKEQVGLHAGVCTCPTCGSAISAERYAAILGRQRAHDAEIIRAIEAKSAREIAKLEATKKGEIAKAVKNVMTTADAKMKVIRANQEATIATRLDQQRQTFEKAAASAVIAERAKYLGEKLKLEEQLQDMQRKLQAKTPHALGEPAEVDLHASLEAAFPDDRILRVGKGQPGPDVIVEVVHRDAVIGKIILDSKNHARWSNKFTSKLRADQLVEEADFAILSSSIFPSGTQQLQLQDNVVIANPERVVVLVDLFRRQIIQNHVLKLGTESRNAKAEQLYDYLLSPAGDEMFDRMLRATRALERLDATEVKSHQVNWAKRAELVRSIMAVREQFCDLLADVIGGGR